MSKQTLGASKGILSFGHRPLSIDLSSEFGASGDQRHINSPHLGEAVKQLAPGNLHGHLASDKTSGSGPSVQLKRDLGLQETEIWENWSMVGALVGKVSYLLLVGCFIFGTFKLFSMQLGNCKISHKWVPSHPKISSASVIHMNPSPVTQSTSHADRSIFGPVVKLLVLLRKNLRLQTNEPTKQDLWRSGDLSSLTTASAISGTLLHTRQMPLEEAEALVKHWQEIKAEALGPNHQIQTLPDILDGSMLSKVSIL